MPKQFAYQDAHGHIYPAHGVLAFQPGLIPGWFDTDKRIFTPSGNPQAQVGHIITDAGVGAGAEKVLSGLRPDRGAQTAPVNHGVVFTSSPAREDHQNADADALRDAESELAAERERVAALDAQLALAQAAAEAKPEEDAHAEANAPESIEAEQPAPETASRVVRRARRAAE